jgi:hypothetical protein
MLDRQKVETILVHRFPGSSAGQIAAAVNGIMSLSDECEEPAAPGREDPRNVGEPKERHAKRRMRVEYRREVGG